MTAPLARFFCGCPVGAIWTAVVLSVVAPGCDVNPNNGPPTGPRIEIGTGSTSYVPLPTTNADGGVPSLPIVQGPQGGYHIWGGVRAFELQPDSLNITYSVLMPPGGEALSVNTYELDLINIEGSFEVGGLIGLVPDPGQANGKLVELRMEVTDRDGKTASSSRSIVALRP